MPCPDCGVSSGRVHSRYGRRLADAPCGGRGVVIELSVRRLFCDNAVCRRVTFAEQVEGLTCRYGRRTPGLQRMLGALGVVLAARAVARLALLLGIVISRMTVLRLVMALPAPAWTTPRVLGIDEFATRKGRRYGPILVACETHQPLDLLPDRDADSVAAWLREHCACRICHPTRSGSMPVLVDRSAQPIASAYVQAGNSPGIGGRCQRAVPCRGGHGVRRGPDCWWRPQCGRRPPPGRPSRRGPERTGPRRLRMACPWRAMAAAMAGSVTVAVRRISASARWKTALATSSRVRTGASGCSTTGRCSAR
ncbi:transposase family protein [Kitasatospora aureofaciens]|uniref:transposase family protein n=1 Tax=Kitasatospora aureofaciens TaxID=1894 RepID=UPI00131BBA99|nr:transposase family protein [Kitasatospora aureofaciens]